MYYVPIGCVCNPTLRLKESKLRSIAFPFDWVLIQPDSLYYILELLLVANMNTEEIVRQHFFKWTRKAKPCSSGGDYTFCDKGNAYVNADRAIVFAHETGTPESIIQTYIRRFDRLKSVLATSTVCLVYISNSIRCPITMDSYHLPHPSYHDLNKVFRLIRSINPGNKMLVYDALHLEDPALLDNGIKYVKIDSPTIMAKIGCRINIKADYESVANN